jgi:hypothetical protein
MLCLSINVGIARLPPRIFPKQGSSEAKECQKPFRDGYGFQEELGIRRVGLYNACHCQQSGLLLDRLDVLVHPEEVRRIVPLLKFHQPLVRRTVGGRDAVGFLLGEEVDVRSATGERF